MGAAFAARIPADSPDLRLCLPAARIIIAGADEIPPDGTGVTGDFDFVHSRDDDPRSYAWGGGGRERRPASAAPKVGKP